MIFFYYVMSILYHLVAFVFHYIKENIGFKCNHNMVSTSDNISCHLLLSGIALKKQMILLHALLYHGWIRPLYFSLRSYLTSYSVKVFPFLTYQYFQNHVLQLSSLSSYKNINTLSFILNDNCDVHSLGL